MTEPDTPPKWREGRDTVTVPLPAASTKSGKPETADLAFRWKVQATRPKTDREWIQWEIDCARRALSRAERTLDEKAEFSMADVDALNAALAHAVTAWCRAHLGRAGRSDLETFETFLKEAPKDLCALVEAAHTAIVLSRVEAAVTPSETVAATRAAVKAILQYPPDPGHRRMSVSE